MGSDSEVRIERLRADSPHLARVAGWEHDQWGYLSPGETRASRRAELEAECGPGGVPSVFVALHGERPVGTASLVAEDMSDRPDLGPWLASVYVLPEWRGRGIASRLVRRVEAEAREAGIERLWLFTPDQQALYVRLGWRERVWLSYRGERVAIMERCLAEE
ncbi:GNAT superfamily N-acetyltransferase [Halomonas campaniensis]|uniref:GNAT superfamily N-acetyltransferase n=1 Tax=Halomonas campaniensis TaxID=213554 RepID=A0A7W5PCD1_9GAMM|nr:GNAT family N-acetyltransferase [Halomonas campaniensis]MBB3332512.1 GNAT superfamily N-acetyltransferase [Halomonas campaniensis]